MDSGVKWLGEIPSHWEVIKTSHLFTHIGSGTTPKSGSEEYYTEDGIPFLQTGDLNDGFIVDTSKKITEKALRDTNLTIYLQGSLVIAMYGATIGKLGILGIDTTVNQACCVLPKSPKVETRYAFYAYLAAKNDLIFQSKGGGQPNISQDTIKNERIPVPSRAEQTAIANYLDTATAKIDAAIAQQQKMIDLLNERKQIIINRAVTKGLNPNAKMKDSGVEWIGEVPEGWEVRKLKYLLNASLMYGANESAESEDESYPRYIRITDIDEDGNLRPDTFRSLPPIKAEPYLLKKGDLLFARSGATAGKTYLFNEDIKACFAGYLIKASLKETLLPDYLNYYTKSGIYENWKKSIFIQATIPNIGAEKYANLQITLPSIKEQKDIVKHLDVETGKINQVVRNCENQISLLQERKQIIINEVVTGKLKIL